MEDPATPQDRFASEGTSRLDDITRMLREEAICAMKADPPDLGRARELMDIYERLQREAGIPLAPPRDELRDAIERELRDDARGYVTAAPPRLRGAFPPVPNAQERMMDKCMGVVSDYFHEYQKIKEGPPEQRAKSLMDLADKFDLASGVDATIESQNLRDAARVCRAQAVAMVTKGTEIARRAVDGVLHHDMVRGPDAGTEGGEGDPDQGGETVNR